MHSQILISYCWYQAFMVSCARECTAWLQRRLSYLQLLPVMPSGVVRFETWRVLYVSSGMFIFWNKDKSCNLVNNLEWEYRTRWWGPCLSKRTMTKANTWRQKNCTKCPIDCIYGRYREEREKRVVNSAWRNPRDFSEEMTLDPGLEEWVGIAQSE